MKFLFRPRALIWSLLVAIAVALPFFTTAKSRRDIYYFEATLSSTSSGAVQIFYDVGNNFNDQDSQTQWIGSNKKPTAFRFGLPPASYRTIRFDPMNHEADMTISKVQIVDRYGNVIRRFPLEQLKANEQIASSVITHDVLEMKTIVPANDPFFQILLDQPMTLTVGFLYSLSTSFVPFLIAFFGVFGLTAIPFGRLRATRFDRIFLWIREHPRRSIAAVSLVVVAVQCHPVIFFGKSFVSPDNAVLLLYDEFPVLPGYKSTELENSMASDVGALMFWHLYCPVIAHDALFKDHELPLWNRYSFSGIPLLAQGQTMFGDPLNWLSILTRSSAWSWDLRFLISHWLLCCGLGLTVFALTRHLSASVLATVAGGFLSFFAFRINHPANFSVEYAPWILLAWVKMVQSVTWRATLRWCLLLMLVNFAEMNSGTMKEAYMLIAFLNLAGVLMLLFTPAPWRLRVRTLLIVAAGGMVVGLISAPTLLTFMRTLSLSWTSYDAPGAAQQPLALVIGFFDDLFIRQSRPGEVTMVPAVNFLMLFGVLWALASFRTLIVDRCFTALALTAALALSMAYGVMPASWITSIPFVANIIHVDNSMSCPLMILVGVLAGYGYALFFARVEPAEWKSTYTVYLLLLGLLLGSYLSAMQQTAKSPFFLGYSWALVLAVASFPLALRVARWRQDTALLVAVMVGGIFLMTWRQSQYLHSPFDDYVTNPQIRANLHPKSAAVSFVDGQMKEPSRPVGFGLTLFPSYNTMLGWESVLGVDPLRNRYQDDLGFAFGIPRIRNADQPIVDEAHTLVPLPGLDMMNVRYYLTMPGGEGHQIPGLKRIGRFDMDVFESPTAWPRAFFTDRITFYDKIEDFVQTVRDSDHRPLAAVQRRQRDLPAGAEFLPSDLATRRIENASDYHLTTNNTSFDVTASGPGVIVLAESFYPGEFQLKVNGKPEKYFRVNHSAKGFVVGAPGNYHVEYDYWPRYMTLSLVLCLVGFAALVGALWLAFRAPRYAVAIARDHRFIT